MTDTISHFNRSQQGLYQGSAPGIWRHNAWAAGHTSDRLTRVQQHDTNTALHRKAQCNMVRNVTIPPHLNAELSTDHKHEQHCSAERTHGLAQTQAPLQMLNVLQMLQAQVWEHVYTVNIINTALTQASDVWPHTKPLVRIKHGCPARLVQQQRCSQASCTQGDNSPAQ